MVDTERVTLLSIIVGFFKPSLGAAALCGTASVVVHACSYHWRVLTGVLMFDRVGGVGEGARGF